MDVLNNTNHKPTPEQHTQDDKKLSKKEQIVELYRAGITEISDLAMMTGARPSYIGTVLRDAELDDHYFDLYTSTSHVMNAYSKFFVGKMRFKDVDSAMQSVELLDTMYHQFERNRDRAGQHHTMVLAMTMANRARWSGKEDEAEVFQNWLLNRLTELG